MVDYKNEKLEITATLKELEQRDLREMMAQHGL